MERETLGSSCIPSYKDLIFHPLRNQEIANLLEDQVSGGITKNKITKYVTFQMVKILGCPESLVGVIEKISYINLSWILYFIFDCLDRVQTGR